MTPPADKKGAPASPGGPAGKDNFPFRFSAVFSVIFLILYHPKFIGVPGKGVFSHLENLWQDELFILRESGLSPGDPKIIVAAMDEDSVSKYSFPLPRDVYARLLDRLKGYGVKTVAFDVTFPNPREHDAELVEATRRFKNVIHLFTTESQQTPHGEVIDMRLPIAGLASASQYLGYPNIDAVIDNDGHIRRSKMFDKRVNDPKDPNRPAPSMDIVAAASFLDKPLKDYVETLAEPEALELTINFRRQRNWLLHEKRDEKSLGKIVNLPEVVSPYQTISIMDILSGDLTEAQRKALKGALIIIGSTTLGYFDHYPTPFTSQAPGVEYHANNIDNLLHDDYLGWVSRGVVMGVILFMIWLPLLLQRAPPAAGNVAAGGVLFSWLALNYWEFSRGTRIDFVAPAIALVSSFLAQTVHRALAEGAEKKFIKQTFGQFVSPDVVEKLVKDPSLVKLGGEKRDMTVLFLDIAHFTTISEKMAPDALILFLNKYLSALSQVIQDRKGTVDKYIGDCIMAFWNAPLDDAAHRANACQAGIECQELMKELNKDLDPTLPETPAIRIGLNSGDMTVGLTGSQKKLAYTVIGDEVNLSSRLEGANKFFGSHIMASESTVDGAKGEVIFRELGRVRVVGKAIPIKVFELLAKKDGVSPEWQKALPLYEKGIEHFNKREYQQSVDFFQGVLKIFPKDGPSSVYLTMATDYSAIAPLDWDGVFNLTAK